MKFLIVHAHPEPQSFNGGLTAAARQALEAAGHEVQVSDLYAMHFDPVSDRRNFTTVKDAAYYKQQLEEMHANESHGFSGDIAAEQDKLDWCDVLVFQFPLWWFGLPGILKGWVDRVFAMGRTYGAGRWYDDGVFTGKRALCSVTLGGPTDMYRPDGLNGDIQQILYPINHGIFFFTGFTALLPFLVHGPVRMSQEEREAEIARYCEYLLNLDNVAPILYHHLSEYDEMMVLKTPIAGVSG